MCVRECTARRIEEQAEIGMLATLMMPIILSFVISVVVNTINTDGDNNIGKTAHLFFRALHPFRLYFTLDQIAGDFTS